MICGAGCLTVLLVARKALYGKRGRRRAADELTVDYKWDAKNMNERSPVMVVSPMCACAASSCRYGISLSQSNPPSCCAAARLHHHAPH